MSGVRREASARPMFSGIGIEWLPALGVSWQTVQVPLSGGPATGSSGPPLRPADVVDTNWRVLKISSPRAIAWRRRARVVQALKMVKTIGLSPPDEVSQAPGMTGGCSADR